ncbi:cell division protein FtsZ [Candidatus Dependentiae bacterium]|nr:cell division protein FtsZ [Candidatus Dependentiae bacterium]
MIDFERESDNRIAVARIKVLGVGGGGSNMVNSMIESGYETIDFIVANTDAQALTLSKAPHKIQLGVKSTKGLGAGADPNVGRRAAEEDIDSVIRQVKGADVVFLTAGLGGGTGSGALPIIARALKEKDILSIAVVTKPFIFEGKRRMKVAQDALELLHEHVDTLIVIPNQKLIEEVDQRVSLINAFSMINGVPNQFIKSIADIIAKPGHINVDFADIKTIMKQRGYAVIGTGRATGDDRAIKAARQAVTSRLLDNASISGARGVLLNISGSSNLGLHELSAAASIVYEQAHEDASIILGSVIDESLGDDVTVTVIATGFSYPAHIQEILPQSLSQIVAQQESMQPARPAGESHSTEASGTQSTAPKEEPIDMNDLEIPAIMRRVLQK